MGPSQKHLYSRISFLHQAASYLSSVTDDIQAKKAISTNDDRAEKEEKTKGTGAAKNQKTQALHSSKKLCEGNPTSSISKPSSPALSLLYVSQSRTIARKATVRLTPEMKHSICKTCDSVLLPGTTSSTFVENLSRGGRKPWADMLVITCNACGAVKRFPVGAKRQRRKTERRKLSEPETTVEGGPAAVLIA
ncbi:MAG: hypothetical protein OHK93_004397 [Ramalina farinacea]|uniref:Rpr2-domain-containing protein n=1 Tax=Ramalina farinacea TaxID=258253 RepID=A0AA43U093_9LECA|nr:hypothetical protein [Ramalina farinacea]